MSQDFPTVIRSLRVLGKGILGLLQRWVGGCREGQHKPTLNTEGLGKSTNGDPHTINLNI